MEASTSFELKTSADIASTSDATTTPTESAILTCIGVSGIVGNRIVLCVLLRDKTTRKRLRNILVINQSLVDFLSCFLFIVIYISKNIPKSYEGAGIWWCWLVDVEVPLWLFIAVSTTNLMAITVERYLMVVFPVVYHNHITANFIYGTIAFVWVFTFVLICAFSYPFSGVYEGVCYLQGCVSLRPPKAS
ncbi:hypothetical protein CAPTEDRAFT_184965 [Capitella teleta]|uniref:G-protein coupled receptors family 1 profile domain-containing protein n=1 Tax=Capitella teleta TaxID=283909 RepID=R7UNI5_CAPTE|nr:hypothetical protein CAPTEDRAFT_184965 [Capitella teleta]|eukprot:ELU04961.1 hypothetical protein CAPTEDRAFT_184965 [Capitella teleta]